MKTKFLVLLALNLVFLISANGQFSANFQTNTISAVTSNWVGNGTYVVGSNTFQDALVIQSGGVLSNGTGYIGYESSASYNIAIIRDSGSAWSNRSSFYVGWLGAGNKLVISNGGVVFGLGTLGESPSSSNNAVVVSGNGSVWNNAVLFAGKSLGGTLTVGESGAANSLIVSNGGAVDSYSAYLGENSSSSNNAVLVTGPGSVWTNAGNAYLAVGDSGAGNKLVISNGGVVWAINSAALLGLNPSSSSNMVTVTGSGSAWRPDDLAVGYWSAGNSLTIADGGSVSVVGGIVLGSNNFSSSNTVTVTGPGSVLIPSGVGPTIGLIIGYSGADNTLTITNGGLVSLVGAPAILGQNTSSSNNAILVSGQGSVWSNFIGLVVGSSGAGNSITISNGGVLYDGPGFGPSVLGSNAVSSGNTVTVTGSGSVWSNGPDLYVGDFGRGNTLTIANGGTVFNTNGYLGYNLGSSNNSMSVSWVGSVWSNTGMLAVGRSGAGNTLTISNGGAVFDSIGDLGGFGSSSNNSVLVSGTGSVWRNTGSLTVGDYGAANSLIISNGGAVYDGTAVLGYFGSNNTVLVSGQSSVWSNQSSLVVGYGGDSNLLQVTGGSVVASNIVIGVGGGYNVLRLDSGSVIAKNAFGNGSLVVGGQGPIGQGLGQGALLINGGNLTVDSLVVTNNTNGSLINTNVVNFNGGVINSGGAAVSNTQMFVVGDGVDVATYHLTGGVHSFANNLEIRSNASLTGCGTINGNVTVDLGGTVLADCGGTLTFTGIVTNNGLMTAINGSVLEGYSLVVNDGTIDITQGTTNFHGGFVNHGTVIGSGSPVTLQITGIARQGNDIRIDWQTPLGATNSLQATAGTANGSYSTNDFADIFGVTNATNTSTNYVDVGGATNSPSRYYRIRLTP